MSRLGRTLIIFCLFMLKVEGEEGVEELGLAEEAFDDQYLGCRQAMEDQLKAQGILEAELSANRNFQSAWKEAEMLWSVKMKDLVGPNLPEGFTDHHGVALVAFTGHIREAFNKAVKSSGKSYRTYMDAFNFKFLHFYVTVALQLLYKDCKGEYQKTYQGFDNVFYWMPEGMATVRFGHFLHTSANQLIAYDVGNSSFFTVLGCSGVPVDKFSEYPHEEEVVFPGYEIFTITQDRDDLNEFSLVGTGKWCSHFNCAFVQGEASRKSMKDCITSEYNITWSEREAGLHNMTEKIFSAGPPGSVFRSGTAGLVSLLIAAVVTILIFMF